MPSVEPKRVIKFLMNKEGAVDEELDWNLFLLRLVHNESRY